MQEPGVTERRAKIRTVNDHAFMAKPTTAMD